MKTLNRNMEFLVYAQLDRHDHLAFLATKLRELKAKEGEQSGYPFYGAVLKVVFTQIVDNLKDEDELLKIVEAMMWVTGTLMKQATAEITRNGMNRGAELIEKMINSSTDTLGFDTGDVVSCVRVSGAQSGTGEFVIQLLDGTTKIITIQ